MDCSYDNFSEQAYMIQMILPVFQLDNWQALFSQACMNMLRAK